MIARAVRVLAAVGAVLAASVGANAIAAGAQAAEPGDPVVLAHYYIWFEPSSWNRAKLDFPLAGRYSSDDVAVMRGHVELAKEVGIDGFIVSWKSTDALDPRLDALVTMAEELDFKLAITYQGLDFNRDPLPVHQVGEDLDRFIERWAASPAFDLFDRPVVVWTGTWEHPPEQLALVTDTRRDDLLFLASAKNVEDYERVADAVEGNLYYWSSVNPLAFPNYPQKLVDMGNAVRRNGHVWIAPAAPGYDAQLLGGTRVVERGDGETLRRSWNGALESVPDAIGVISWNEFSENTHIEPSRLHGVSALEELARLTGSPRPRITDFDSSAPQGVSREAGSQRIVILTLLVLLVVGSAGVVWRRQRRVDLAPDGAP